MVMQIKRVVVVIPRVFPLVHLKGTAEQTFIFIDTLDPRSYKKTYGQAVVQKEDPVAKRIVITENAWKMCQRLCHSKLLVRLTGCQTLFSKRALRRIILTANV